MQYWYDQGRKELLTAIGREKLNLNMAKNVILFLGRKK